MATETVTKCDYCGQTIVTSLYWFVANAFREGGDLTTPIALSLQEQSKKYCTRVCMLADQTNAVDG